MTLYTFATTLTGNPDEAREIILEVLESFKILKPVDPASFLLITVRNKCYDYLRLSAGGL